MAGIMIEFWVGGVAVVDIEESNSGGREDICGGGIMKGEGPRFPVDAFRLCFKWNQKINRRTKTSTNPLPRAPPTMAPIEGEWDDEDWLGKDEESADRGGVETEDDGLEMMNQSSLLRKRRRWWGSRLSSSQRMLLPRYWLPPSLFGLSWAVNSHWE